MSNIKELQDRRIATYDSETTRHYFRSVTDIIGAVGIKSSEEIVEETWQLWAGAIPSRMSSGFLERIQTESPELPAELDSSTFEFSSPEE